MTQPTAIDASSEPWTERFVPPGVRDPVARKFLRVSAEVNLQVALFLTCLLPVWAYTMPEVVVGLAVFPVLAVASLVFTRRGAMAYAVHAAAAVVMGHWALLCWWSGGIASPFVPCLALGVLFPAMFARLEGAVLWAASAPTLYAIMAMLEAEGAQPGPIPDVPFLSVVPVIVIVAAVLITLFQLVWYANSVSSRLVGVHGDLSRARDDAHAANEAKSAFLAAMSHEIRTPINGVLGVVDLLATTDLDRKQRGYVETIRSSSNALVDLVEDILDFSRIEAGHVRLDNAPFEPMAIVRQVTDLLRVRAREKGLRLELDVGHGVPGRLVGDGGRIRQILFNLVGNAIKYTDQGHITVRLHCLDRNPRVARVRIEVQDSGIGIPAADLERIFERFTQVEHGLEYQVGGTGLGLAITKHLVDLMEGTLTVESTPGRGSLFAVDVELQTEATLIADDDDLPPLPAARILLAEDNPVNRKVALAILDHLGCVGDTAANGELAVRMAQARPYDLILMDCEMPIIDGYEATRRMRHLGMTMPIIAMTAHSLPEHRRRCEDAGMNDFIEKPVHMDDVHRTLARWLLDP